MDLEAFVRALPKAELHVHIEGTLEPELMFELAQRNGIELPFAAVEDVRAAYEFTDLQSFLDIYYQGAAVLLTEQDFYELMMAYLDRAQADGVRRAEVFFDPQTHTERGIDFSVVHGRFRASHRRRQRQMGDLCRADPVFPAPPARSDALATWHASEPFRDQIIAVGLDSSEVGNPPGLFAEPYRLAREAGLHVVAHAGEEGPPQYVVDAVELLGAERIDHGVRSEDDAEVVAWLAAEGIPLTMCPLSNVKLQVFDRIEDHNLKRLMSSGVLVTVNSDDPAYFGGYILDNYLAVAKGLDLTPSEIATVARNSIEASFISDADRTVLLDDLDALVARFAPFEMVSRSAAAGNGSTP